MDNIYANPVGNTKKDIYIIKNRINEKVYIGQSINSLERFKNHCKRNSDNSLIDKAIQKYGKENFYYEILEYQVEDYNEKEIYWIERMNSLSPNGYNILKGDNEPPRYIGENHPSSKLTDLEVLEIKELLKNSLLSLSEIAKKFTISKKQVLRINQGISRASMKETYPIREVPNLNGKLNEEQISLIREMLEFTYLFNGEIARIYNVDVHTISKINEGKSHYIENVSYPIREWTSSGTVQFTYEQVSEIISLLQTSNKSFREIARLYNCSHSIISKINQGTTKKYKRKNTTYPIRNF